MYTASLCETIGIGRVRTGEKTLVAWPRRTRHVGGGDAYAALCTKCQRAATQSALRYGVVQDYLGDLAAVTPREASIWVRVAAKLMPSCP